jgi:hypothetical protein
VRVGVIGAGRIGGTLARLLGQHGHEVVVTASRDRAALEPVVAGWRGVEAGEREDVVGCEVVVLAFPWRVAEQALAGLDLAATSSWTRPTRSPRSSTSSTPARRDRPGAIAALLPGARVVKAFNTLPGREAGRSGGRDGPDGATHRHPRRLGRRGRTRRGGRPGRGPRLHGRPGRRARRGPRPDAAGVPAVHGPAQRPGARAPGPPAHRLTPAAASGGPLVRGDRCAGSGRHRRAGSRGRHGCWSAPTATRRGPG